MDFANYTHLLINANMTGAKDDISMTYSDKIPQSAKDLSMVLLEESRKAYSQSRVFYGVTSKNGGDSPFYNFIISVYGIGKNNIMNLELLLNPAPKVEVSKTMTMGFEALMPTPESADSAIRFLESINNYIDSIGYCSSFDGCSKNDDVKQHITLENYSDIVLVNSHTTKILARGHAAINVFDGRLDFLKEKPVTYLGYFP